MKIAYAAAAAVLLTALAPIIGIVSILAAPVATAAPCQVDVVPSPACMACLQSNGRVGPGVAGPCFGVTPAQASPSSVPVQTPAAPPKPAPPTYAPPSTMPAQAPVTTPAQAPPPPAKVAVVRPPNGLDARPDACDAAKRNRLGPFDPSNPPRSPDVVDFSQRVQDVINGHSRNVDVVNGQAYPRHWDYIDHDQDNHPVIYNPMGEGMTFRYYYQGDYREAYVEAGSSVSFSFSEGVFPFTAVGGTYLTTGSFYSGMAPVVYQNVNAYIPAYSQYVQIGTMQILGHDDSQPTGGQDTFMLNDSTLAHGQATNPSDGGQITVTKTQTLPGVGPTDDGKSLIDLTAASQPQSDHTPWVIGGLIVIFGLALLALGACVWVLIRRRERTA
jgi:hypothetical protein